MSKAKQKCVRLMSDANRLDRLDQKFDILCAGCGYALPGNSDHVRAMVDADDFSLQADPPGQLQQCGTCTASDVQHCLPRL